jgi:RNA polymerase-binding transcription factor DksA
MELKTEAGYIYCARCGRLIKRRPRENVKYLRLCPQCRRKTFEELRIKLAEVLA